jgi:hypothetical protein
MNLTHVMIWYTVAGDRIEARIRTYADAIAIREESVVVSDAALSASIKGGAWTEDDLLAAALLEHATLAASDPKVPSLTGTPLWVTDPAAAALVTDIAVQG